MIWYENQNADNYIKTHSSNTNWEPQGSLRPPTRYEMIQDLQKTCPGRWQAEYSATSQIVLEVGNRIKPLVSNQDELNYSLRSTDYAD